MSICFVIGLLFASAATAHAATFPVTNTNDSGPGSLRQAIIDANNSADNDIIEFALSGCPCVITLASGELFIANNGGLTINGPGASQLSVSGNNTSRVFFNDGANAAINGVTVIAGKRDFGAGVFNLGSLVLTNVIVSHNTISIPTYGINGGGGGIYNSSFAALTLLNSTVSNNSVNSYGGGEGGGIYNSDFAVLTLTNSTVSNNSVISYGRGGGIYNSDSGSVTLTNSVVDNNTSYYGGGISNLGTLMLTNSTFTSNTIGAGGNGGGGVWNTGTATIAYSTFSNNVGLDYTTGGGILNLGPGTMTITTSTVRGNSAAVGGGVSNTGTLTINNTTISGNSAFAAGIANSGSLTLINSTVSGNVGDYWVGSGILNSGTATVGNTIIAGNTSTDGPQDVDGSFNSQGYNLIGQGDGSTGFSGIGDQVGTSSEAIDPVLGPLQDNGGPTFTHALLAGSPAIDASGPTDLTTDQRGSGFDRVVGAAADIGAFEVQTVICPRPQGYWKNNPDAWPVEELTLGDEVYTKAELLAILNTPAGTGRNADASLILAYQLIAAKLNAESGANTGSVDATIEAADALLSSYEGRLPLSVRSSTANGQLMLGYGSTLDAFNKATTTASCTQ